MKKNKPLEIKLFEGAPYIEATLVFILDGDQVLTLDRNPEKSIYGGKVSGVGGKVEDAETVSQAALREIQEETGLHVSNLKHRGVYTRFAYNKKKQKAYVGVVHILFAELDGDIHTIENDEGTLKWMRISDFIQHERIVNHIKKYFRLLLEHPHITYTGWGLYVNDKMITHQGSELTHSSLLK